jgi:hypothetical protein
MSHREDHVLEHPALAPSHLDLVPWNKQWRVHEPKKKHAGQIQTLLTNPKRQYVAVVRPPPHPSALHPPIRSMEGRPRAIGPCQREPAAHKADDRANQKPHREKLYREDPGKHGGYWSIKR